MNRPTLLFCNHFVSRLEHDAQLALAARKELGLRSIVLTHGARAVAEARRLGFNEAYDLSWTGGTPPKDPTLPIKRLAAVEASAPARTLREDIAQDRWLAGRYSFEWSLGYLTRVLDLTEIVISSSQIVAGIGELNYAAYRLVRRLLSSRQIPYLSYAHARVFPRFYLEPTFYWEHPRCVATYRKYLRDGVPAHLASAASVGIRQVTELRTEPDYAAAARARQLHEQSLSAQLRWVTRGLSRRLPPRTPAIWPPNPPEPEGLIQVVLRQFRRRDSKRHYKKVSVASIPREPFAVYFLHESPEYTVDTLGWPFRDQVFLVERIAESLPLDMPLLVKEHISMQGRRERAVYERLHAIPNVVLYSGDLRSTDLIARASVVFTISGTAAIEAMAFGTPAIIFSPVFHGHFSGIDRCRDLLDLPDMIRSSLLHGQSSSSESEVLAAFAAMYSTSHPGTLFNPHSLEWRESSNMQQVRDGFLADLALHCRLPIPASTSSAENRDKDEVE